MIKQPLNKLDLNLYHETLKNGLNIYMIPNNKINNIYATYTTFYGSSINEFIPIGENDYKRVPDGVAHFLEHKIFEQENGESPFQFYSKNGADVNAYTSFFGTTYLFSGIEKFKENLQFLLKYVETPYFTDENVEKEKGIIVQEIQMHKDNPYRVGKIKLIENAFVLNPIRIPVIGNEESVNSITKEDLYTCYNTFYHPSNMILVITGNFNPEEALEYIKDIEDERNLEQQDIRIKECDEPNNVHREEENINLNVSIPKVFIGIKIDIENLIKKYPKHLIMRYINMYMNIKFGNISKLQEELVENNIITTDIEIDKINTNKHILYIIYADTEKKEEFINKICNQLNDKIILEEDFIRKKKLFLSNNITMSDNIYRLNEKVINDILLNKEVITDFYEVYNSLNIDTLNEIIKEIDFSNICKVTINN